MEDPGWNEYATPTLMRAARGVYAQSIRAQLRLIEVDDLPENGVFVLAGIDSAGGPRQDLPAGLGVTKQAVSQVIDILVNRGYLTRRIDPDDRRRFVLELTDRGYQVVDVASRAVDAVDRQLAERVSAEQVEAMRSALIALAKIKGAAITTGAGQRRTPRQLRSFSPIFPVRDLAAALAHYAALGFRTFAYEGGGEYGFASRDGVDLHLSAHAGPDFHPASAYLYVHDADALYEEWSRPGLAGHTHPVGPTDYKLREGSHVDPDGNLIRFGSPMPD
ncbi:MAG TPA: MarR family transcriptional regulator [Streptosporangiaceae bacterium]|nr:MarR family transcriptional regulator [Streptosporangiaceae bacterium]